MSRSEAGGDSLLGGASWATLSEFIQIGAGLVTTIALARLIDEVAVAVVAAGLSMHRLVQPLLALGSSQLAVRAVAKGDDASLIVSRVLTTVTAGSIVGSLGLGLAGSIVDLGVSPAVLMLLGASEGLAVATVGSLVALAEALKRAAVGTALKLTSAAVRLCAVGFAWLTGVESVLGWSAWIGGAGVVTAALAAMYALRRFGLVVRPSRWSREDAREGSLLAVNTSAQSGLADIDKALLNGIGNEQAAGHYAVSYRIISLAYVPATALARSQLAEFFRLGADRTAVRALARRLGWIGGAVGLAAGLGILVAAPLIPVVFGDAFEESVRLARLLAWLPIVKSVQYFWANLLTGTGRQKQRVAALVSAGAVNACLNLVLIPTQGVEGAIIATGVSELGYLAALYTLGRRATGDREW